MKFLLRKGLRVALIPIGKMIGRGKSNLLLQLLNAICNLEVQPRGVKWELTEHKLLLDFSAVIAAAGGSGGGVSLYKITTMPAGNQDYFMAKTWDGTNLGATEVAIAKRFEQRPSVLNVTILGTDIVYAYTDDNHRSSDDGVTTQQEELYTPFEVDDGTTNGLVLVAALSAASGVVDADGNDIRLVDMTPRVWAKFA